MIRTGPLQCHESEIARQVTKHILLQFSNHVTEVDHATESDEPGNERLHQNVSGLPSDLYGDRPARGRRSLGGAAPGGAVGLRADLRDVRRLHGAALAPPHARVRRVRRDMHGVRQTVRGAPRSGRTDEALCRELPALWRELPSNGRNEQIGPSTARARIQWQIVGHDPTRQ